MRIRKPTNTRHSYPSEVERIVRPQIVGAMRAVKHHFKLRHEYGNTACRNWCAEMKRIDAGAAYSTAQAQIAAEA